MWHCGYLSTFSLLKKRLNGSLFLIPSHISGDESLDSGAQQFDEECRGCGGVSSRQQTLKLRLLLTDAIRAASVYFETLLSWQNRSAQCILFHLALFPLATVFSFEGVWSHVFASDVMCECMAPYVFPWLHYNVCCIVSEVTNVSHQVAHLSSPAALLVNEVREPQSTPLT